MYSSNQHEVLYRKNARGVNQSQKDRHRDQETEEQHTIQKPNINRAPHRVQYPDRFL